MRLVLCITLLAFLGWQQLVGQVLCLAGKQFVFPELALRAGVSSSFQVRLDVVGLSPQNIQIRILDSSSSKILDLSKTLDLFRPSIEENLKRLTFLTDTIGLELKLRYSAAKLRQVNTSFAECVSDNEVRFVAQRPVVYTDIDGGFIPNPGIDTLYIDGTVPYKSGKIRPSDILVQRTFGENRDSTIIIRNNYPELAEEILAIAASYKKVYFTNLAPNGSRFFIRFRVRREIPECGINQNY